jgi:hypothetical protein
VETARQGRVALQVEDRRVGLIMRELNRYDMKITALQETKWLGNAVYNFGESVLLMAGYPVPVPRKPIQRGEGVALVLIGPAIQVWRAAGQQWRAWSSRLVSVCLQTGRRKADRTVLLCSNTSSKQSTEG